MVRALFTLAVAGTAVLGLSACSHNVTVNYPGNNPVVYPWRACGMSCEQAFTELQATQSAAGQACDDLIQKAVADQGGDPFVTAAELYDSALLLLLRGKADDASARFARAEALDADPAYKEMEQLARDSAAKYPVLSVAPPPAGPPPVTAPAPAPAPAPVSAPVVAPPAPAPSSAP